MARKRPTREEKRAKIRASLVGAAQELFAEHGYWGVSLDQIADRVGLTKGAVYSNFESKEELLLAVATELRVDLDESHLADPGLSLEEKLRITARQIASISTSRQIRRIAPREMELATLALTSPVVRQAMAETGRSQLQNLAGFLTEQAEREGIAFSCPPIELAALLTAVRIGLLQLALLSQQGVPADYFEDGFAMILAGAQRPRRKAAP
jgi:AcrR family transcriptional regulator